MILVDTSAWIEFFRGRDPLAAAVDAALAANEAALCGPIETELRRGLRTEAERRKVIPLLRACHYLESPERLWQEAGDLGFALRRRGVSPKTVDLLIAVHALSHSATLLSADKDFASMRAAGVPLLLRAD
ncbi:MAG TPA: PIN domain-containing protein [Polyangiales bacterium]